MTSIWASFFGREGSGRGGVDSKERREEIEKRFKDAVRNGLYINVREIWDDAKRMGVDLRIDSEDVRVGIKTMFLDPVTFRDTSDGGMFNNFIKFFRDNGVEPDIQGALKDAIEFLLSEEHRKEFFGGIKEDRLEDRKRDYEQKIFSLLSMARGRYGEGTGEILKNIHSSLDDETADLLVKHILEYLDDFLKA
jgi:hypothetical protein